MNAPPRPHIHIANLIEAREVLARTRRANDETHAEIARQLNISRSQLGALERGDRPLRVDLWINWCHIENYDILLAKRPAQ